MAKYRRHVMKIYHPIKGEVTFDKKRKAVRAFELMIDVMEEKQDEVKDVIGRISRESWLKEYGTMRFGLSRQAGHSALINWFSNKRNNVGVIANKCSALSYYNKIKHRWSFGNFASSMKNHDLDYLFIDNATYFPKEKEKLLYKICAEMSTLKMIMFIE